MKRAALLVSAFVALGIAVTVAILPPASFRPDPKEPPPRVQLGGQDVPAGPEGDARALEIARKFLAGSIAVDLGDGEKRAIPLGALGAEIDRVQLASWLAQVRDPASPTRRAHRGKRTPVALPMPIRVQSQAATATLLELKDEIDHAPVDARFDLETKKLLAEQPGRWLDVLGTLARIEAAIADGKGEVQAALDARPPRLLASQLGDVAYAETIGWFETRYNADKKHEARTYNLRLAASKVDGHVILPGETFDFNDVVGPRDEANGYKVAPVIAQGELVDGIGGGTCQISGTLHGAAFFAGLEIVERHPHTRPSSYIKMGMDATVVYPTITFRVRNPFPHPVVLHETVRDGVVRAEILGPKRSRTITFIRKIDDVVPFAEIERPDSRLPRGVRVLSQRGIPGFKIRRWRVVRDGPFAVRQRFQETYPPTTQIIRVGTGDMPKDSVRAQDDPHAEYVADEYLAVLQGPDVKSPKATGPEPGGGMVEVREPGRTGEYGWTEREGFSHWSGGKREREGDGDAADARAGKPDRAEKVPKGDPRAGGKSAAEKVPGDKVPGDKGPGDKGTKKGRRERKG